MNKPLIVIIGCLYIYKLRSFALIILLTTPKSNLPLYSSLIKLITLPMSFMDFAPLDLIELVIMSFISFSIFYLLNISFKVAWFQDLTFWRRIFGWKLEGHFVFAPTNFCIKLVNADFWRTNCTNVCIVINLPLFMTLIFLMLMVPIKFKTIPPSLQLDRINLCIYQAVQET